MKKYIILNGGLGNQLFQLLYAIKSESTETRLIPFILKNRFYQKLFLRQTVRTLNLQYFTHPIEYSKFGIAKEIIFLFFIIPMLFIRKKHSNFRVLQSYYYDYCQNVSNSDLELIKKINFNEDAFNKNVKEQIKKIDCENNNVAFIHIRRGDYLKSKIYKVIPLATYLKILKSLKITTCLIFTDSKKDIQYELSKLTTTYNIQFIFSDENNTDIEDFYIMSKFKNGIIANSTFSWWAALIDNNQNKNIYAPKFWFNTQNFDQPLYPNHWKIYE